jgi:hypothetical protein
MKTILYSEFNYKLTNVLRTKLNFAIIVRWNLANYEKLKQTREIHNDDDDDDIFLLFY